MTILERVRSIIARGSKGRPDVWLLTLIILLSLMGLVWVYDASFVTAFTEKGDAGYYAGKQVSWLLMGGVALILTMHIDYHWWRRLSLPGMLVVLLLLTLVVTVHAISPEINYAHRWIRLGSFPLQLQPSELAKLALIFYAAHWLSRKGDKVRNFYYGLVPFSIMLGVIIGLIELEPDLGTSLVIVSIGMAMFFIAGADLFQLIVGLVLAGGTFALMIHFSRAARLAAFLDPWRDPLGTGYHPIQSLYGIGSGGIFGVGLGESRQKYAWLPEAYTDSIFSVIAEEVGLIGSIVLIILFILIAYRGYRTALNAPDSYGALVATGVTSWIAFQAMLNIGVNTTLIPFTGIPLPFISYGGSSLWVLMAACGILLNISRASERAIATAGVQKMPPRQIKAWFGLPTFALPRLQKPTLPSLRDIPASLAAARASARTSILVPGRVSQLLSIFGLEDSAEEKHDSGFTPVFKKGATETPTLQRAESVVQTPLTRSRTAEPRYYTRQRPAAGSQNNEVPAPGSAPRTGMKRDTSSFTERR